MKSLPLLLVLALAAPLSAAEPHWAFQPVKRPTVAAIRNSQSEIRNPVDAFLLTKLRPQGLDLARPADRATLLRRVTLDLIGVPPTREELHAFLNDSTADAYERVVERLLDDPRYGERWARHWMDVWRYSDWYGRRAVPDVMNSYPQVWRWRDWIVRSLNEDRGYDRMITEMLAADEVCPEDDANIVATGFLVRNWFKWNYNQWMRDNVEHVGKAFLGLTFNCCHCHDHKYDPITQEEYFKFRAFFEPLELRHERVAGEPDPGQFVKYVYGVAYGPIKSGAIRIFDEKPEAPTLFYTGGDERNKVAGRAPVAPGMPRSLGGDKLQIETIKLPPVAWYPGLKSWLQHEEIAKRAAALKAAETEWAKVRDKPSIKHAFLEIPPPDKAFAESELARARADLAALQARITADRVTYLGEPGDAKAAAQAASRAERQLAFDTAVAARLKLALQIAQTIKEQRAKLQAQVLPSEAAITQARVNLAKDTATYTPLTPQYPKVSSGRRTALARWITSRDNPLTARVAVNHVWNWHFGRPLVESTFDFGRKGQKPSHPELLDWLASELMANDWKFKPLHRQIVLSTAYRMSSRAPASEVDPDNRLWSRFPTQRMEAEVLRDSLLSVAGEIDPTMGGPEIPHEQGQVSKRRTLYFAHHGESTMAWLTMFDAPSACDCYRRTSSVMPQQALALSNSDLALHCGRALARRLHAQSKDDTAFIRAAFEQVLSRPPTAAEAEVAAEFITEQRNLFAANKATITAVPDGPASDPALRAREDFVHALLNHNDFVTIR